MVKHRTANERVSKVDDMAARLAAAGATPDEIAEFRESWDDMTDDEQVTVVGMNNRQLRAELLAVRAENEYHTLTPAEQQQRDAVRADVSEATAAHRDRVALAHQVAYGTVDDVLSWVGDDRWRAAAALEVEAQARRPRRGVQDRLTALLAGDGSMPARDVPGDATTPQTSTGGA